VVSDSDIDKYGLPFAKGSGRYWTRDAERDMYLWGGKGGNPALGEIIYGYFHFFINNVELEIAVTPGEGSKSYRDSPYIIEWKAIDSVFPSNHGGLDMNIVRIFLKEALVAYAEDGGENSFAPNCVVRFGF
jgi:hypothetical protein